MINSGLFYFRFLSSNRDFAFPPKRQAIKSRTSCFFTNYQIYGKLPPDPDRRKQKKKNKNEKSIPQRVFNDPFPDATPTKTPIHVVLMKTIGSTK
jgi:hypothetical protein